MSQHVATRRVAELRVPEITAFFWVIKALSTAMGEATSDYLVHVMAPVAAVGLGFVGFLVALGLQLSRHRYVAWAYWLAVVMVGVFGTMAADVLHVGLHVPYVVSSILFAVVLAVIFLVWSHTEHTLSIHEINTPRRELFYWATVVATFATGTAVGDLTATVLHLGYLRSGLLFAAVLLAIALSFWRRRWNPILAFWLAYIMTRPLGASSADWVGKPKSVGGLGIGSGVVSLSLTLAIVVLVGYLSVTHSDVQHRGAHLR
jgi:uncharacterized membrane-anchored protein